MGFSSIIRAPLAQSPVLPCSHRIFRASTEIENETACRRVLSENGRKKNDQEESRIPLEVHFLASVGLVGRSSGKSSTPCIDEPSRVSRRFQAEIVFATGKRTSSIILCCAVARLFARLHRGKLLLSRGLGFPILHPG